MSAIRRVDVAGVARLPTFSHATVVERHVHVSGTLGSDGERLTVVPGGVAAETRQALAHIRTVLAACGATMDDIVKTNVYLIGMEHFAAMNDVYARFFTAPPPARISMVVHELALGASVEIDCIAYLPDEAMGTRPLSGIAVPRALPANS